MKQTVHIVIYGGTDHSMHGKIQCFERDQIRFFYSEAELDYLMEHIYQNTQKVITKKNTAV